MAPPLYLSQAETLRILAPNPILTFLRSGVIASGVDRAVPLPRPFTPRGRLWRYGQGPKPDRVVYFDEEDD